MDAIVQVQHLAEGLIEATRHAKHRFREEWVRQLIARYRALPGKPIIHLYDLGDDVIPTLSCERVRPTLIPYWKKLVAERGYDWSFMHFRGIRDIAVDARKVSRWSKLCAWRKFSALTGLQVNALEPYVVAIRVSHVGTSRVITHPKLPFNLATPAGAKMIGYRGDAAHETSAFHNKNQELHQDYRNAILNAIGEVPFTTTVRPDHYIRTNVGTFITELTSIAGIDNSQRQKIARNPLPSWFFLSDDETIAAGLRALWDAEGNPNAKMLRLSQAVLWTRSNWTPPTTRMAEKQMFSELDSSTQDELLLRPPLLLVSAALLAYRIGIISYTIPASTANTKHQSSVYWTQHIYRTTNMRRFEEKIGFLSSDKQRKLTQYNLLHKPSSPSPLFSKERC